MTLYTIQCCGVEQDALPCTVSAIPFCTVWPGHQRPLSQTEEAAFFSCETDDAVELAVTSSRPFQKAVVRPLSRCIVPERRGNTLYLTLTPGQYTLELDGQHHALHLFIDRKKEYVLPPQTLRFSPGEHDVGDLWLKSGDTVYIPRGARVYGRFLADEAENITICGGGIVDGSRIPRTETLDGSPTNRKLVIGETCTGLLKFYNCRNVRIEGVTFFDSPFWTMEFCGCENLLIDNIKMIGMWRYNSDGIDFVNSRNCTVKDSFFRCFDDIIVPRGKIPWMHTPTENITTTGCVLWCDWGRSLELGAITLADDIRNILYCDCDLIHNTHSAMSVHNACRAKVYQVMYENIRVEYAADCQEPLFQESDDMVYAPSDKPFMANLFDISPQNWPTMPEDFLAHRENSDIVYRNIQVFAEEGLPFPPVHFHGFSENQKTRRIMIDGVYFNGRRLESFDELHAHSNGYVEDIRFL